MSLRILAVAIAVAIPVLAHADPKADAKQHIKRAASLHSAGKFNDALKELTLAYALDPDPELLFAIGQVHMKLGNCTDAVTFYQRYLASNPPASDAAVVNEAIKRCNEDKPQATEPTTTLPEVHAEPAHVEAVPLPVVRVAPPVESRPWYRDALGNTFVGTGVIAGAVAGVIYHAALSHRDNVDTAATYTDWHIERAEFGASRSDHRDHRRIRCRRSRGDRARALPRDRRWGKLVRARRRGNPSERWRTRHVARAVLIFTLVLASCVRAGAGFRCAADSDCSGGTCEAVGYCSFADAACAGGLRFGDNSGPFANQCVGALDAGVDAPADVMVDAPINPPFLVNALFGNTEDASTLTYPMTVPPGANRYMIVSVQLGSDCHVLEPDISSVTFDGIPLTQLATITGTPCGMTTTRTDQWVLVAPPTGTFPILVTLSAVTAYSVHSGALAFANVNQTTPVRMSVNATESGTGSFLAIPSTLGDLVVTTVGYGGNFITGAGTDQTIAFNDSEGGGDTLDNAAASTQPGVSPSVAAFWSGGSNDEWQLIGTSLEPP